MKVFATAKEAEKSRKKGQEVRRVGKGKYILVNRDKDWEREEEINMYEEEEDE